MFFSFYSRQTVFLTDARTGESFLLQVKLETAVLQEYCNQLASNDVIALREQIGRVSVVRRQNTGAGFYTYFAIEKAPAIRIESDTKRCHVVAKVNGVEDAFGFLLWLKGGYVDFLEGYTLAFLDSTSELDLAMLDFEISKGTSG
jgi:hypothetical protein